MYPIVKAQFRQLESANFRAWRWEISGISSDLTDNPSESIRWMASSRSLSDSLLLLAGKSRRMNEAMMLHPAVIVPSMINSHLQPAIPYFPSKPPSIPPAIKPPKAPERMAAEM
jgi:hypothetical protein